MDAARVGVDGNRLVVSKLSRKLFTRRVSSKQRRIVDHPSRCSAGNSPEVANSTPGFRVNFHNYFCYYARVTVLSAVGVRLRRNISCAAQRPPSQFACTVAPVGQLSPRQCNRAHVSL